MEGDQSDLERTVVASTPSKIHHSPKDALFRSMESIEGVDFGEGSVSVIVSDAELSKTSSRASVQDLNIANSNPRIFKTQSSVELLEDSDEEKVVDEDPSYNSTEREDSIDILPASSSINVIGSSEHITDHVDHVKARNSLSNDTTVSIRSSVSSIAILGTSSQSPDFTLPYSLQDGPDSAEYEAFDEMPDSSTVAEEEEEGGVGILETSLELMTTSAETVQTEVSQEAMSVDTVISPSVSFDQKNYWKSEPYSNTTPGLDEGSFQDDEALKEQSSNIDCADESKLPASPNLLDDVSSPTSKIQDTLDQLPTYSLETTNMESPLTEVVDEAILPPKSEENPVLNTITPFDGSGTEKLISEAENGAISNSTKEFGNLEVQSTSSLQLSTETVIYTQIPEQYDVTVSELPGYYESCPSDAQETSSNQINISTSELKLSDKDEVSEETAEKIVITPAQSSEQATRVEQLTETSVMLEQTQISNSDLHDILQILPSRAGFVVSEISGQTDAATLDIHESEISEKLKAPVSEIPVQVVAASSEIQEQECILISENKEQPNIPISEIKFQKNPDVSDQKDIMASEIRGEKDISPPDTLELPKDFVSEIPEQLDVDSQTQVISKQEDALTSEISEQLDVDSQTQVISKQEDALTSEISEQLDVDSQTQEISKQEDALTSKISEKLDVDSQTQVISNQEDALTSEISEKLDVDSQTQVISNQEDALTSEISEQLDVDSQTQVISNQEDALTSEISEKLDVDSQTQVILNQEDALASEISEKLDVDSQTQVISNQEDALASEISEQLNVDAQTQVISNQEDALASEIQDQPVVQSPEIEIQVNPDRQHLDIIPASETQIQNQADITSAEIPNQLETASSEILVQKALPSSETQDDSNAASSYYIQEQPDSALTIPEHPEETSPETFKQPQVSRCMYPNVVIKPSLQIAEGDIEALKMMDPVEYSSSVESTPSSELPPSISSREHKVTTTEFPLFCLIVCYSY